MPAATFQFSLPQWPSTTEGHPQLSFDFRQKPEDFVVTEILGFEPSGEGEHLLLWIEKRNLTTLQVREQLAQRHKIPAKHIGHSGLKDKIAVTRQWLSIPYNDDINAPTKIIVGNGYFEILRAERHHRKIKIGTHKNNQFELTLRNVCSADASQTHHAIASEFEKRIHRITHEGFPNYFGPQRFGHKGGNIPKVVAWFNERKKISREKQSLYLSSARSFIFNELLAARVKNKSWNQYQPGDKLILCGSQSYFSIDPHNKAELEETNKRLEEGDIAIAGPMPGRGEDLSIEQQALIENSNHKDLIAELLRGLEENGAKNQYRALGVTPIGLKANHGNDEHGEVIVKLEFILPKGAFATALLTYLSPLVTKE